MKIPSTSEYKRALNNVFPSAPKSHQRMFEAHYRAKEYTITAKELAEAAGYENFNAANLQYGTFCRKICENLSFVPQIGASGKPTPTYVIATGTEYKSSLWKWVLRPEVIAAVESLGLFETEPLCASAPTIFADEVNQSECYIEGAVLTVTVNAYERNPEARAACLEYWGYSCVVCEMDFEATYGPIGSGFIHVHHKIPLSIIGAEYSVDPINDLRPVCPNCHAMLHRHQPQLSTDELRAIRRDKKSA